MNSHQTFVFTSRSNSEVTLDRSVWPPCWRLPDDIKTFQELGARYPDLDAKLICAMLDSHDCRVTRASWNDGSKTLLDQIVSDLRGVIQRLGGKQNMIRTLRHVGYDIPQTFTRVIQSPAANSPSQNIDLPSDPTVDLPELKLFDDLRQFVTERRWTLLQVLPGGGAEEAVHILRRTLRNTHVLSIDVSVLKEPASVLTTIANNSESSSDSLAIDTSNYHQLARSVSGGVQSLVIFVFGFGSHHQLYGRESTFRLAATLKQFENVRHQPYVGIVLVLPVSHHHIVRPALEGSILNLTRLLPTSLDHAVMTRWARLRLQALLATDVEELLDVARGQLYALVHVVRLTHRPQSERIAAIRAEHERNGLAILSSVGGCCRDTLLGKRVRPRCKQTLIDAGILVEDDHAVIPRIPEWALGWKPRS